MQGRTPGQRSGCSTVLMLIAVVIVAGILLSFLVHLVVGIIVVLAGILIIGALWRFVNHWF